MELLCLLGKYDTRPTEQPPIDLRTRMLRLCISSSLFNLPGSVIQRVLSMQELFWDCSHQDALSMYIIHLRDEPPKISSKAAE